MNFKTGRTGGWAGAFLLICTYGAAQAASPVPFADNFDTLYSDGQVLNGSNGWGASSSSVVATSAEYVSPSLAALTPAAQILSNQFASSYASNVWVDCWVKEAAHLPPYLTVDVNTNDAVTLYMNTNNQVVVYDSDVAGWRICTTDYMNNASAVFSSGGWAHLTVNLNYATKKTAVFLNGHLVVDQLALINTNTLTALSKLSLEGGVRAASYWDGVWVSTNWPQATYVTNDLDADGMADAEEVHLYGNTTRYVGSRTVPSTDYATISSALAVALARERVVVSNAAYAESVVVSNGVTLTCTNLAVTATNWTMSGSVEVKSGATVLVSGGLAVFANLTINAGGLVMVSNATVTVNGWVLSGTFTLDSGWQTVTPRPVSFTETFEGYREGTMLGALGQYGWSVSATSVQVQAGGMSGNGVQCPVVQTATNHVSATVGAKLWTDLYLKDTNTVEDVSHIMVDPGQTVTLCVGTNGYVMVYSGGWLTCSNDALGGNVDGLWSNGWNRISIFLDYGVHKASVFLNGRLLKEQIGFINSNTNQMKWVDVEASMRGDTWFDTLSVTNGIPAGLAAGPDADLDHDGLPDALEIQQYGSLSTYPRGSVFRIR